jgi:glyoxylase-like metal-dependent hydrolase (beta-lactamase superfamily II)
LIFQQIQAGGDRNFGYLIGDDDSKLAAVVDVSYLPEEFIIIASQHKLKIVYVISTHDHGDHTYGNAEIKERIGAKIVMHKLAPDKADILVDDGDVLKLGELELKVIHTPGHTLDCICILVDNKLLTGDTLFVGKVGGTNTDDFARIEYDSLLDKLMTLDDSIEVYPGHDYGVAPTSTIGNERETNPFLLRKDFKDFKWLKDNWAAYKLEHGIK